MSIEIYVIDWAKFTHFAFFVRFEQIYMFIILYRNIKFCRKCQKPEKGFLPLRELFRHNILF